MDLRVPNGGPSSRASSRPSSSRRSARALRPRMTKQEIRDLWRTSANKVFKEIHGRPINPFVYVLARTKRRQKAKNLQEIRVSIKRRKCY